MSNAARKRRAEDDASFDLGRARVVRRGPKGGRNLRMTLRGLRAASGMTQVAVSEASGIAQPDVSIVERKPEADFQELAISTVQRYLAALGGELELVAVFPKTGHRFTLCGYGGDGAEAEANPGRPRRARGT